ncbi:MAG TPA: DNA-processing protein DprA, partial [Candidatus Rifleibacterium sp.]|nr:DNA-processing protein DprA [Candidatus Rifleibacterium sp.]
DLLAIKGWDIRRAERFVAEAARVEPVCPPEVLDRKDVRLVTFNDEEYPALLREIPDSPVALFVRGRLDFGSAPAIAIVGARNGTQMGYDIARDFGCRLARAGFVVVNGPDVVYPRGNLKIRDAILKKGAVISEYAPGTIARPWFFPVRNRIISGMCVATLVVEASARSGSLITARLAGEQNREIFAIPGSIKSSTSEGTLSLLQEGGIMVTDPDEIIRYYSALLPDKAFEAEKKQDDDLTDEEKKLLSQLASEAVSLDRLLENGWQRERLSLLLQLEMRDYVIKLTGSTYQARKKVNEKR